MTLVVLRTPKSPTPNSTPGMSAVHFGAPGALIAALPTLLGFYPTKSLVVVHMRDGQLIQLTHHDIAGPNLIEECAAAVARHNPDATILIAVAPDPYLDWPAKSTLPALRPDSLDSLCGLRKGRNPSPSRLLDRCDRG
jgi:hypothetical protein